jgi:dUTP pyrophosphatase
MIIGRKEIVARMADGELVSHLISDEQIQQAGVDLTVGKVYSLAGEGALDFDNSKRVICDYSELPLRGDHWLLEPGVYHCAMNEWINIPLDLCGLLLPRSSALAIGITIHSALWDPGYNGRSFMHTVVAKRAKIYENARLAQMVFIRISGEASSYAGTYLGEDVLNLGRRGAQERIDDWDSPEGSGD